MAEVRICIVGGGSYNWTPTLLRDIALTPELSGTVVLHDIDPAAATEMCRLGEAVMAQSGAGFRVEAEADPNAALRGADFVIVTITTGGLEAMRHDLEIPNRYGIVQSVGDTVGPGGLSRALRNIPVMVGIARRMERVCPDAWLLNLTNPMATLTRAVATTTTVKVVGLCHEVYGVRRTVARLCGATAEDVELRVAGINHLPWLLGIAVRGQDAMPVVRERLLDGRDGPDPVNPEQDEARATFVDRWGVKRALYDVYGVLAGAGDRHLSEFFSTFLSAEGEHGAAFGVLPTTVEHRYRLADAARATVRGWLAGDAPIPMTRSEEEVSHIIAAMALGRPRTTVVNLPNIGQIDNLPRGAVVETMGVVGAAGIDPLAVGALPAGIVGTLAPHVANQELIVEAALMGDRSLALQALVGDPLVRDVGAAPRLLDELLRANAAYLPAFAG